MTLATLLLASCPAWQAGDSEPIYVPAGCAISTPGIWRTVEGEATVDAAVVALRRCAANEARAARLLREVPEPPSRVTWALVGLAVGVSLVLGADAVQ